MAIPSVQLVQGTFDAALPATTSPSHGVGPLGAGAGDFISYGSAAAQTGLGEPSLAWSAGVAPVTTRGRPGRAQPAQASRTSTQGYMAGAGTHGGAVGAATTVSL